MATTHSAQKSPSRYDDALRASHREARATILSAVLIALYFWISLWLTKGSPILIWGFPLWFWVTIIGSMILSIVVVLYLTQVVFTDMDYEAVLEEDQ